MPRALPEHRILEEHGIAQIAKTFSGDTHVGFRIKCGRHNDTGVLPGKCCQKHIVIGVTDEPLADEECIRRLKRWFICGGNRVVERNFLEGKRRTCHLKYGGPRLAELASDCEDAALFGVPDDELNDMCADVTH